jgi:hypothetical protein
VSTQADVYRRASQIIGERGWCQHKTFGRRGPLDVNAALGLAERELGYPTSEPPTNELFAEHVGMLCYQWNDKAGRTQADVHQMLEQVAQAAGAES